MKKFILIISMIFLSMFVFGQTSVLDPVSSGGGDGDSSFSEITITDTARIYDAIKFGDGTIQTSASAGGGGGDSSWSEATVSDTLRIDGTIKFSDGTTLKSGEAGTIESTDQGEVMARNAFITADSPDGTAHSFNWGFDSDPILKVRVRSDGSGGFDSSMVAYQLEKDTLINTNDNDTTEIYNQNGDPIRISKAEIQTTNGGFNVSYTSNVSNPPTDAELDALISPAVGSATNIRVYVIDSDSDNMYLVSSDGTYWFTWAGVKAL